MKRNHARRRMLFVRAGGILTLLLCCSLFAGCRTGPLAEFYSYNPFHRQGPEEEEYGLSPVERREQIRATAQRIRKMPPAEKLQLGAELALDMQNEIDPIVRADIVRTLGKVNTDSAKEALNMAMYDAETRVRLAACEAWQEAGGPEAIEALSEILSNDADIDVRLAATRALGQLSDPAAVEALAIALQDPSPALQYRAMESLKKVSGRDLGHDVVAWRNFIESAAPPSPTPREGPSLVERFQDRF